MTQWTASWIWPQGHAWTVDAHVLARREFSVTPGITSARLHISAYTDYTVWVNGALVGRGPEPNDAWFQTYDTYDIEQFLTEGSNVAAVLAHNYGIGTHWYHRGRGGLIAQIEMDTDAGTQTVGTDDQWRVLPHGPYAPNAPRQFWSADFLEAYDARREPVGWRTSGFEDTGWQTPEVLGPVGTKPWTRLLPRDIPLLRETRQPAVSAERGRFTPPPVHAVGFSQILDPGETSIVFAQGVVRLERPQEITLHFECDDAFRAFVNGDQALESRYSEYFSATRVWRGKDEYDQQHDGIFDSGHWQKMTLPAGENIITVAVDHGRRGWGFLLALLDAETSQPLDLPVRWSLVGPTPSTGFCDSLDGVTAELPTEPIPFVADAEAVTDYAAIMGYETRADLTPCAPSAITLKADEVCLLDVGRVYAGYPDLTLTATEGAILDVGESQILASDRKIRFSNDGRMKSVDRLILRAGAQSWQPTTRRAVRFLHLSCRRGEVTVDQAAVQAAFYPTEVQAVFECSDPLLNRIWETSVYTTRLVMQQGYQDCLKREQGTHNTSSFNYASRSALCAFGDRLLARKTIRQAFRTQNESGWFDSHGISSPNSDEVTECLWMSVWLKDYLLYTGDREFAAEVFDNLEDTLRFFHKGINRFGLIEGRNRPIAWQGQGVYVDDSVNYGQYMGLFGGELFGFNLLYFAALQAAGQIAEWIGQADRADYYARRAAWVRRSVNARFWDADRGLYRDWRDGETLGDAYHPILQIAAAYFEIGDAAQTRALVRYLTEDLGLPTEEKSDYPLFTFGFYHYFLEDLFRDRQDQTALTLLRIFYGRWLELGATTFGEFFRPMEHLSQTELTQEYEVHAYGTSAHLHFYTNLLGIQPLEPGFARVRIAPRPGEIAWAKGRIATPHGPIHVSWEKQDGLRLTVDGPREIIYETDGPAVVNGEERH